MNSITYAAVFQQELDKQMTAEAVTAWMDENSGLAKYSGGNEIKIPKLSLDGLATYSRANGFQKGKLSLAWETRTMRMDRGRSFTLDKNDVDESNFSLAAGTVMGEFQKVQVVPEVDAYRISQLFQSAGDNKRTYTPAASSIFKELKADIAAVQDKIGSGEPLVIMMSIPVAIILDTNDSVSRQLSVGDFRTGEISTQVKMVDQHPILLVPSARMKSAYTFWNGEADTSTGEDSAKVYTDKAAGGFEAASGAKEINWIICARNAPIGVCKTDTIRIFAPAENPAADAWKIDYRKYHDVWVPDNKVNGLFVNYKA